MIEIWKPIPKFAGYEASNLGKIRHAKTKRVRITRYKKGYEVMTLKHRQYFVHRLVLSAFQPPPGADCEVDHKDWDRLNNNLSNLRWLSREDNLQHRRLEFKSYVPFRLLLAKHGDEETCKKLEELL